MYKLTINKTIEKDNFHEGCNGNFSDLGDIETKTFKSLDDLKKHIDSNYGVDGLSLFDDHMIYQCNEDDQGNMITLSELRPDGWLACYNLYIEKIETELIGNDQLRTIFPNLSEA